LSDFRNTASTADLFKWKQAKPQYEEDVEDVGDGGLGDVSQHPKHKNKKSKQ
jgi:hypothetical protein